MKIWRQWKKVVGIVSLTAGMLILGTGVVIISVGTVLDPVKAESPAADEGSAPATEAAGLMAEAQTPINNYYLPYPGILPDSPLYKLKAIRDKLTLWLEFDQEKKARKELLYADKRVNAAGFLLQGGKAGLAVTTATKAEKYLEQAVNRTMRLKEKGKDVNSLMGEMVKAGGKHLELLQSLREKTTGDERKSLEISMAGTKLLQERLEQGLREASGGV